MVYAPSMTITSGGHLDVDFGLPCTTEAIIETANRTGYTVIQRSRWGDGVSLLVILLGLFVIARQLGWAEIFQAFPTVNAQRMDHAALFFAGLLTSVHCIAMCDGFLSGAVSVFAFCLGTIPLVLLFGVTAGIMKANWRRWMLQAGAALLVLMGLFTVKTRPHRWVQACLSLFQFQIT